MWGNASAWRRCTARLGCERAFVTCGAVVSTDTRSAAGSVVFLRDGTQGCQLMSRPPTAVRQQQAVLCCRSRGTPHGRRGSGGGSPTAPGDAAQRGVAARPARRSSAFVRSAPRQRRWLRRWASNSSTVVEIRRRVAGSARWVCSGSAGAEWATASWRRGSPRRWRPGRRIRFNQRRRDGHIPQVYQVPCTVMG
jgi:hypothetical protein